MRFQVECRVYGIQLHSFALACRVSFRVRSFGIRFRVSEFVFRVSDFGFRVSSIGVRVSGFGFRAVGKSRVSGSVRGVYSTDLATRGESQVNVTSRIQSLGLWVSGFGFRVSG